MRRLGTVGHYAVSFTYCNNELVPITKIIAMKFSCANF